jgi:hypothetical protein
VQNDKVFIDVSQVLFDKEDALRRAAEANQIAIFDLDSGQEINVPSTPTERTSASNHQEVLNANAGQDLSGLPGPVNVPGIGPLQFHGHGDIQRMAHEYNQQAGIKGQHPTDYTRVNPQVGAQIAHEYDQMEHNPHDPHVKAAYNALATETRAQYDHAVKNGYNFEFYPDHDPYPNSPREAVLDLHHNRHMYVYPTHDGYGNGEDDHADHPLLEDSGVQWGGKPVTHNDLFRAVHDFYGHAKEGLGFRADGEDNAFRQHAAMFSPLARKALTSETRGQNSWVNYGPHGEANQTAGQADTVFAPQKAGLLPDWVEDQNLHRQSKTANQDIDVKTYKYQGTGRHPRTPHGRSFPWVYSPSSNTLHLGVVDTYHNDLIQAVPELKQSLGPADGNAPSMRANNEVFGRMSIPPRKVMMFSSDAHPELKQALVDRVGGELHEPPKEDEWTF